MKVTVFRIYSLMFILSMICLFSSCKKENNDFQPMVGTVWIHQFRPGDNIINGAAAALHFGKSKAEYYALDGNMKIKRLIKSLDYRVREQTIVIGIKECTLNDNALNFNGRTYYRSNKKISDLQAK